MVAAAPSAVVAAVAAEPPPRHQADPHERFFASAPGSHHPGPTEGWTLPPGGRTRSYLALLALGAFVIIGLVAGGIWRSQHAVEDLAGPGSNRERRSGWIEGARQASAPAPEPAAPAPAIPAPGPELVPERPLAPRGGGFAAAGGLVKPEAMSSGRDAQNRAGPPIAKKDKRLLDLLDRKQDAAGVAAPAAGELNTGRASLDEATIRKTLADNSGAFSSCIAKAAKSDPRISREKRTQVLELVVRSTGRVSQATLDDPAYAKTPLGLCLGAAARRIIFPSFEGEEILVQAPLKISAVQ
jgi:hypothetical protein